MEQYLGEVLTGVVTALITYFSTRKKNKVDTKQIEVDVLEKSLQVLNKDVVQPLRENLELLQDDYSVITQKLNTLQNAINKMYSCRSLSACPIRIELSKSEKPNRKGNSNRTRGNRPRDSTSGEDNEAVNDTSDNGEPDSDGGSNK